MNIIIVGAGTVGAHLAKQLSEESHNVVIIDSDPGCAERLADLDVMVIHGNGGSTDNLIKAGVDKADLLLAVTESDETNIIASMIASTLGVETRVARVRSKEYFKGSAIIQPIDLGIDLLINPEEEAAQEIINLIERPYATERKLFCEGKLELISLIISEECPLVGKPLKQVGTLISRDFRISLIVRNDEPLIPGGETVIATGDRIFFIALSGSVENIIRDLKVAWREISSIFIIGGGVIGASIAHTFEEKRRFKTKIVETKRERALRLSEMLPKTLVLEGDGTNVELLIREGFADSDAFIAVTSEDELNILSCLLARQHGVPYTIPLVQRTDYVPLTASMRLQAISPREITVERILKYVRGKKVVSMNTLAEDKAEVLEYRVSKESVIAGKALKDSRFPGSAVIGAIIRDNEPVIPTGETVVLPDDRIFVFTLSATVKQIGKLF